MVDRKTQAKVAQQAGGIGTGAGLGLILAWALAQAGVDMPGAVAVALGSVLGGVVQEISALFGAWKDDWSL